MSLRSKRGFTLVEMLVAIAVFMSVMVIAVSALLTVINANKKDQAIKTVVDNVSFALDSIARDMRTAVRQPDGSYYACSTNQGSNFTPTACSSSGVTAVAYTAPGGTLTAYRFVASPNPGEGNIQRCLGSWSCSGANPWQSLTAPTSTVSINSMKFYLFNLGGQLSPQVLIAVEGSVITQTGPSTFSIQSTISERSR